MTAYPDKVVRDRALKDGVVCYLRKPSMRSISSGAFVRLSIPVSRHEREFMNPFRAGQVN